MQEMPEYAGNFANFRVHDAIYRTEQKEETILLEFRGTALEKELLFTIVNDEPIRINSIHELVHSLPSLISLSIRHSIRLLWNGAAKRAEIVEIFRPSEDPNRPIASLQLSLNVDNSTYETTVCDTLQDAIWELEEMTEVEAEWWLCTCFDCHYSGHARYYAVSDREYWCYRDVPEALAEIQTKGRNASSDARFAGRYFVNAFHTCAGWQPRRGSFPVD